MAKIPNNFDGVKLREKYNLTEHDFYAVGDELICPSLPDLTDADLLDCIASPRYTITPDDNHTVINNPVDITVTGAANEAVTLYAYPVTDVPDVSHELDVALDADGRGVVPFVADSAGQWAIRGKAGALATVVSIILVVA